MYVKQYLFIIAAFSKTLDLKYPNYKKNNSG